METVDASIVFLPRYTTLVANLTTHFEFTTLPLDVSRYSGAQFQIWRSPMSDGTFKFFMEESLDAQKWVLGATAPEGHELASDDTKFCSYSFRLRWFRLRIRLEGTGTSIVTCWAEGLLRGGGFGVWPGAAAPLAGGVPSATTDAVSPPAFQPPPGDVLALTPQMQAQLDMAAQAAEQIRNAAIAGVGGGK